jgi:hypothetical protein
VAVVSQPEDEEDSGIAMGWPQLTNRAPKK